MARIRRALIALAIAIGSTSSLSIPSAHATGTAVEYFNKSMGHFFVTAFPDEAAALDAGKIVGWVRTGYTFPVDTAATGGAEPVCRFFSTAFAPKSSHFYTPYAMECATLKGNPIWTYEAIAFYLALPDAAGNCPAGATRIYRLYNNGVTGAPNHRYTADTGVLKIMKTQGWIPEGDGVTEVFACGPAPPPDSSTFTGEIELNAQLRYLTTADGSAIVEQTDTRLVFAKAVSVLPGDVFVVPENGVYRAVTVTTSGVQTVVEIEEPTIDEVFSKLDVAGSIDLGAVALPSALGSTPGGAASGHKALPLQTKSVEFDDVVIARTFDENGQPGFRIDFNLQADCPGQQKKLRFVEVRTEFYGPIQYKANKGDMTAAKVSYRYKLKGGVYVGCKLVLPVNLAKIPALRFPVPAAPWLSIVVPVFVRAQLETDMAPTFRVLELNAESGLTATTSAAPTSNLADKSVFAPLLLGASAGDQFTATLSAEIDVPAKLIGLFNFHLATGGVKMGPELEVQAKAVLRSGGADVDICATLTWPTEVYLQYRWLKIMKTVTIFKKDFAIPYASFSSCTGGPSGTWKFTTTSCLAEATNPPTCNVYCNPTFEYRLAANPDLSKIDMFETSGAKALVVEMLPLAAPAPARTYGGCYMSSPGSCDLTYTIMNFSTDYRSAPTWSFAGFYNGVCGFQQGGTAALQ